MAESYEQPQEFEVDDPEDLSQKKRVRDLLNRRNDVIEARNMALDEQLLGEANQQQALAHYQSRIESLIIDLYTKFAGYNDEDSDENLGEEYLQEVQIDTIEIPPPPEMQQKTQTDLAPGESLPESKTVEIRGLEWFIENEPVVTKHFTVKSWNPPQEMTVPNSRLIPFRTLDKALLKCTEFMDEIGIDAQLDEKEQQTKIDKDLLEEVDEWRQKKVE